MLRDATFIELLLTAFQPPTELAENAQITHLGPGRVALAPIDGEPLTSSGDAFLQHINVAAQAGQSSPCHESLALDVARSNEVLPAHGRVLCASRGSARIKGAPSMQLIGVCMLAGGAEA